jgi:hypothetical protein
LKICLLEKFSTAMYIIRVATAIIDGRGVKKMWLTIFIKVVSWQMHEGVSLS